MLGSPFKAVDPSCFWKDTWKHSYIVELFSFSSPGPAPVPQPGVKSERGPTLDLELVPALFLPPPLVVEPLSTVPVLEEEQTSALAQMPSPEPESDGPSPIVRISSPPLQVFTEPAPASEASCHWQVTSNNSPTEEKPGVIAFPLQLVAEQLTIIDAVSSWFLVRG